MKTTIAFLLLFGVAMGEVVKRQVAGYRQNIPRYQPGPSVPHGFRASTPVDEESDEIIERNSVSPTQHTYVNRPQQSVQFRPQDARSRPQEYNNGYQQGRRPQNKLNLKEEELEEEEKEEPDRLTMLLPQSKFNCEGKNTGYYADDGLNCEVFHYCQDNARHSWICPEGFLFHQVHLICMPPSSDNICTQSSQYHFVNDYLYKPINEAEVLSKPNVTLRYSDRYYPENYYEEEAPAPSPSPRPRPVIQHQQPIYQAPRPVPQQILRQPNQVFHSPEEVNIPLQHRRPVPSPHPLRNYQQSSEEYEY